VLKNVILQTAAGTTEHFSGIRRNFHVVLSSASDGS